IDWPTFRQSFLPAGDETILTVTPLNGLVKTLKGYKLAPNGVLFETKDDQDLHLILDGKQFEMATNSVIPITTWTDYSIGNEDDPKNRTQVPEPKPAQAVGVAPMDLRQDQFQSMHEVTVQRISLEKQNDGSEKTVVEEISGIAFKRETISKAVPAGLWGNVFQPNVNGTKLVEGATTGLKLSPRGKGEGGTTHSLPRANLSYDTEVISEAFDLAEPSPALLDDGVVSEKNLNPRPSFAERDDLLAFFWDRVELENTQNRATATELLI
ncbi:MAG: hypothetical protein R3264_04935, partial [Anaerolineae bacterium]|nr:hypothetical protein [Anaerolineae bacterium]